MPARLPRVLFVPQPALAGGMLYIPSNLMYITQCKISLGWDWWRQAEG